MNGLMAPGTSRALPGNLFPFGATPGDGGTNFAVASGADAVQLPEVLGYDAEDSDRPSPLDSAARSSCCRCTTTCPRRSWPPAALTNYWGYNTIGYFAPHAAYSAAARQGRPGGQVAEFQAMVDALHGAGLEVVLDVVFNHTAEGDHRGPTLCHRGIDNAAYYGSTPQTRAATWTRPAAATRSTRRARSPCR